MFSTSFGPKNSVLHSKKVYFSLGFLKIYLATSKTVDMYLYDKKKIFENRLSR